MILVVRCLHGSLRLLHGHLLDGNSREKVNNYCRDLNFSFCFIFFYLFHRVEEAYTESRVVSEAIVALKNLFFFVKTHNEKVDEGLAENGSIAVIIICGRSIGCDLLLGLEPLADSLRVKLDEVGEQLLDVVLEFKRA